MRGLAKGLLAASLLCSLLPAHGLAQATAAPRIEAIHARLYYEGSRSFSDDLTPRMALWNTIIGEGDASEPSNSTLVTVEVSGRHLPIGGISVVITARGADNRLVAQREESVFIYNERTRFHAPLWIYDTGCEEITISARLVGDGVDPSVKTQTIPFHCGE